MPSSKMNDCADIYISLSYIMIMIKLRKELRLTIVADGDLRLQIAGGAVSPNPADEVVNPLAACLEVERSLGWTSVRDPGAVVVTLLGDLKHVVPVGPVKYESLSC